MNFEKWYFNFDETNGVASAKDGWSACKEEVLKILKKDWTGCDLSINSCDKHYIEEIEKL